MKGCCENQMKSRGYRVAQNKMLYRGWLWQAFPDTCAAESSTFSLTLPPSVRSSMFYSCSTKAHSPKTPRTQVSRPHSTPIPHRSHSNPSMVPGPSGSGQKPPSNLSAPPVCAYFKLDPEPTTSPYHLPPASLAGLSKTPPLPSPHFPSRFLTASYRPTGCFCPPPPIPGGHVAMSEAL